MSAKPRILFVDDEPILHELVHETLQDEYETTTRLDGTSALETLRQDGPADLVLLDINMPGLNGLDALTQMIAIAPRMPVVMLTGLNEASLAIQAMQTGARAFLHKPIAIAELRATIARVLTENAVPPPAPDAPEFLVGSSPAMHRVLTLLQRLADSDAIVLIKGETGTGKELVARALNDKGRRRNGPFVPVPCAAIPPESLGSELFGHEDDVLAEATLRHIGFFEAAKGGTLFFDEIGELPASLQGKLQRVIEDRAFRRLGGDQTINVNARLVFATNRDLELETRTGAFRKELFYRINVVSLALPPLRDRREDIPELVAGFTRYFAAQLGRPAPQFTPAALRVLGEQPWPGNVRELKHTIERLLVMSDAPRISAVDLETIFAVPAR